MSDGPTNLQSSLLTYNLTIYQFVSFKKSSYSLRKVLEVAEKHRRVEDVVRDLKQEGWRVVDAAKECFMIDDLPS